MPHIQALLYYVPSPVIAIVMIGGSVLLTIGGLYLVRLFVPTTRIKMHNDVAGFIFATVGVIYAVLLAFMVIVVWQNFDNANSNVAKEANCIAAVYRDSTVLAPSFQRAVTPALKDYASEIINDEWPLLRHGKRSERVQRAQVKLWALYGGYEPKTESQKVFYAESVRKLNDAGELRRMRILDSQSGIHSSLWFVLLSGGIITILFTLFFGTENFGAQMIMSSLLATLISLILFTIMSLDYPFTGSVSISPDVFRIILQSLLSA